jgi:hypothetical protein
MLTVLLVAVACNLVLGVFQIVGGPMSLAYTYNDKSPGLLVGVFTNRNHEAALLACVMPMTVVWLQSPYSPDLGTKIKRRMRLVGSVALVLLSTSALLLTGSRAGLAVALLGALLALGIARVSFGSILRSVPRPFLFVLGTVPVIAVVGLFALQGRALSVTRMFDANAVGNDLRFVMLPTVLHLVHLVFPVGTGFGVFEPAFRMIEPDAVLHTNYYNHAHSDYLEIAITGGLPAIVILMVAIAWMMKIGISAMRRQALRSPDGRLAALGFGIAVILAAASVTDYPVRTPIMTMILAVACCWMAAWRSDSSFPRRRTNPDGGRLA